MNLQNTTGRKILWDLYSSYYSCIHWLSENWPRNIVCDDLHKQKLSDKAFLQHQCRQTQYTHSLTRKVVHPHTSHKVFQHLFNPCNVQGIQTQCVGAALQQVCLVVDSQSRKVTVCPWLASVQSTNIVFLLGIDLTSVCKLSTAKHKLYIQLRTQYDEVMSFDRFRTNRGEKENCGYVQIL